MSNDHNADECKRFAGEREAFMEQYPASKSLGWNGSEFAPARDSHWQRHACEQLNPLWRCWKLARAAQPAPVVPEGYVLVPEKKETGEWESARIGDFNSGWNACRDAVVTLLQKAAWMELDTTKRSIAIQDELRSMLSASPAQGQQAEFGDAYQGAREDMAIWKRRALEAEEKVRQQDSIIDHLTLEAQGETRMGEPYLAQGQQVECQDHASEAAEILRNMIDSIEKHGNYSQESTLLFLNQAHGLLACATASTTQGGDV